MSSSTGPVAPLLNASVPPVRVIGAVPVNRRPFTGKKAVPELVIVINVLPLVLSSCSVLVCLPVKRQRGQRACHAAVDANVGVGPVAV